MNTFSETLKRNVCGLTALLLMVSIAVPAFFTRSASAALLTDRSIKMSTSAVGATGVTYHVEFTVPTTGTQLQGIVVDFCTTALLETSCTKPTGLFTTTTPAMSNFTGTTGGSWTIDDDNTQRNVVLVNTTGTSSISGTISFDVTTMTNPTTPNQTFFGRIYTFADDVDALAYDGTGAVTGDVDSGTTAMAVTTTIGVTATVVETLTFCVSAANPGVGCSGATSPQITLGHGSPLLLDTTAVDTSDVYFQVSTNAGGAAGTTVRAKGSANLASGSNTIAGQGATPLAFTAGIGKFGFNVTGGTGSAGSNTMTPSAPYNNAAGTYALDSSTGGENVTTTYGDTVASGTGIMIDAENIMTFAATAAGTTAAGVYTAQYSLIAHPSY